MVQTSWTSFDWLVLLAFASKVGRQRGMRSVPPRGSGWVQPVAFENLANSHADHQPTRYCVVVLTSCHVDDPLLRQSPAKRKLFQTVLHQARLVKRRSSSSVTAFGVPSLGMVMAAPIWTRTMPGFAKYCCRLFSS